MVPDGLVAELAEVRASSTSYDALDGFDPAVHRFRMASRRLKRRLQLLGREIERLRTKESTSYAHMHPDDLESLAISDGQMVEISSRARWCAPW